MSNASEATELLEKALENRKFRYNTESFMLIQFAIVHMEYVKKERNEMILKELKEGDSEEGIDLDNVSLESATVNKKSFLRIYEGVRLTDEWVKELVARGKYDIQKRQELDVKMTSMIQILLKDCFGGNAQTTMILCVSPSATMLQQ